MKFIILQKKLKEGLNIVERVAGKNLTLPVLNNILISAQKNFVNLTSTDLEIGIKWWSLVKTEKEGEVVVPARILSSFINYLPDKPVLFETKEKNLFIECENYKTQIKYFENEDFPIIPQVKKEEAITLDNLLFCRNISFVSGIPQLSPVKVEMSGIYHSFQENLLKIAATDGFRLGEKKIFLEKPVGEKYSFILPQKTAKELTGVLGDKKGELKLYSSPNQVMFEFPMTETAHPEIQIISRLIEGEYPNYEDVIPKEYQLQVVLVKNVFLNQIKAASVFSGKTNEVKFRIDAKKERLEIFSQNQDFGQYQSFLPAKTKNNLGRDVFEIAFNHKFLIDGLLNMESSEVVFEFTEEKESGEKGATSIVKGVLKPFADQTYLYIVMPLGNTG